MIYDLSRRLASGMPHFPGDPEPRVEELSGTGSWRISMLQLGSHSGTHIDAPRHYLSGGRGIGAYTPERFIHTGLLVDATGFDDDQEIGADVLAPYAALILRATIVVLRTGWAQHWGTERYFRHPYLGAALTAALIGYGVSLVGIDAPNVDSTPASSGSAHGLLLGADILIVENLCGLEALRAGVAYIFAFIPLAVGEIDGAPVRALAWTPEHRFA